MQEAKSLCPKDRVQNVDGESTISSHDSYTLLCDCGIADIADIADMIVLQKNAEQ